MIVNYSPWGCKEPDTTEPLHFTSPIPEKYKIKLEFLTSWSRGSDTAPRTISASCPLLVELGFIIHSGFLQQDEECCQLPTPASLQLGKSNRKEDILCTHSSRKVLISVPWVNHPCSPGGITVPRRKCIIIGPTLVAYLEGWKWWGSQWDWTHQDHLEIKGKRMGKCSRK